MFIRRLVVAGSILWLFISGPARAQMPAESVSSKLHPALLRLAEESDQAVKAWVFFTDKGARSVAEYDQALSQLAQSYNRRAVWRRQMRGNNAARGGALFDARDLAVVEDYVDAVAVSGARVHIRSRWLNAVSVWAGPGELQAIAELPFVRALQLVARGRRIEPPLEVQPAGPGPDARAAQGGGALDYGLATDQLNQINLINLHAAGATGSGVIIGVLDTGFRRDHVAFNHPDKPLNVIAEYDFLNDDGNTDIEVGDPSAQHFHGTLILGTMAAYAPGELVGAAFDASYILCKTEDTTNEYPAEEDNYVAGLEFIEANGGDVTNSSLGYIEWYTQGDLDGQTAVTTIAVNTATANGVHCCTSAGNDGNDTDPTTSHLLAPADAFQVLAVGAVDSNGGTSPFSSDGPSADGRVKPEVMARGVDTWTITGYEDTGYNSATGTSISSPQVASAVACLVGLHPEWTVDQMRTVLFHSADDFLANGTHDPLFVRGFGEINAYAAGLDCNLNGMLDACDIDCGPGGGACDLPGCAGSVDCNSDGIPDDCEPDCNGNGVADACDLADCLPDDAGCQDCNRNGVPDVCDDPFPQQGRVTLDRQTYVCLDTAMIRVNDCGLDSDAGLVESVEVLIHSSSEPAGEVVLLTETGPDSGAFEGSIPLSSFNSSGVLVVNHADVVSAVYLDADNGLGDLDVLVTTEAEVDCNAPVVSDVQAEVPGPFDAVISFATDEPSAATVRYGLACNALDLQAGEAQYLTAFNIPLADLTATTTYFLAIDVVDPYGNAETYDNGGFCYTLQTPEIPNYYTELFEENDNDLDFRSILFTPDGSPDIYAACSFEILELPTDPAGGTLLNMDTADFVPVTLPGGASVSLYGVSYSTFYVGGYGYITFEAGDDESWETLDHHFDQPRISALFELLEPELGTISWKLLLDRVVVTWEDVPSFFQDNSNTFQVAMYFDGRIQLSYLTIDDDDGLAGLSAGTGVVPGFAETDFSALGSCGPQPPAVDDFEVVTEVNAPLEIDLLAIDDGQPDPPGALSYIITSLPEHGTLNDPQLGMIITVPHTLTGSSGIVDFVPTPWFSGFDGLQYKVNDGGVPPDGGDSETATVTITVGSPQTIYSFGMDIDPGWTTEGQWAFGQPTGGGSHDGDPSSGFTGSNVYGYNLNGDYPNDLPPTHLITTRLDCSQIIHTELRFQRWLGVEWSNFDHATVSVSNNGLTWVTVWDHDGGAISDTAWVLLSLDISDQADGQSTVYLRWTMGPTDDLVTYPGWNIDDVEIRAVMTNRPGDLNGDGAVNAADLAVLLGSWGACMQCPADLNLDGTVDAADLALLLGNWS